MLNYIKFTFLRFLPKHGLSNLIYHLSRIKLKLFKNFIINIFIKIYNVDMDEAEYENIQDYESFNDFFTRNLKKNVRKWTLDSRFILSPVDGQISQIGDIDNNDLIQAKNYKYSLDGLLGAEKDLAYEFKNGSFVTLYLSPRDYHRIHMPITGRLIKSIYVPGNLYPVNKSSVENVKRLFSRNERLISIFETKLGLMAQIMIGAIFVGSMETVWAGEIKSTNKDKILMNEYLRESIKLNQGEEFGHFNMGSTVILLFQKDKVLWGRDIKNDTLINVGQILGNKENG